MRKISIIIYTKNEEKWLVYCLLSLFFQKFEAELEVIIIDDNITEHTKETVKRFPVVKVPDINKFLLG